MLKKPRLISLRFQSLEQAKRWYRKARSQANISSRLVRHRLLQFGLVLLIPLCGTQGLAAEISANSEAVTKTVDRKETPRPFVFSLAGLGGPMARFSSIKGKPGILVGGRGAGNVTDHFTIGGGGCGLVNAIHVTDTALRDYLMKFGYGGPEVGYIFNPGGAVSFSANFLMAVGLVIRKAESGGGTKFSWFYAVEPALYATMQVVSFLHINIGVTYRRLASLHADGISSQQLSGFAGSVALLFGRKRPTGGQK